MTQAAPDKPQPHVPDYEFWREPEPDQPTDNTRPDMRVVGFPETLEDALPHDQPITVRRGGTPWPVAPTLKDAFERFEEEARREGRWIAPTEMLGLDGEPLVEPAPEHPLPPGTWVRGDGPSVGLFDSAMRMEPETPPAPHPLIRAIDRAFTPRPERESEETTPGELPGWAAELQYWWTSTASSDIGGSIDKIALYGGRGAAYDLIATGHDLAALNGRTVGDEEATELAILWYVSSKLNRLMAAAIDGRRGSDDTIFDSVYYLMMMRRNRAVGGWPVKAAHREKETPTA